MANWALIVGINTYPPAAISGELKGAVADAADFAEWALHPSGGNVSPGRLLFRTFPAPAAMPPGQFASWQDMQGSATPANFAAPPALREIVETGLSAAKQARRSGEPSRIYVFLAGHGVQSNEFDSTVDPQTCFIAGDFSAQNRLAHGVLPCQDFRRLLLADGFTEVVMFLDCCRSPMTRLDQHILPLKGGPPPGNALWVMGEATLPQGIAWEVPDPDAKRGAFSSVLLQGLRTVREANDELTLEGLRHHVRTSIGDVVKPRTQAPQFSPDRHIVLLRAPPIALAADIEFHFAPSIAAGAAFELVHRSNEKQTIVAAPVVVVRADAGRPYAIENANHTIVIPFDHPGPGKTVVHVE